MKSLLVLCFFGLTVVIAAKSLDADENELILEVKPAKVYGPCAKHHCALGKECRLDEEGEPMCDCAKSCPPEPEERAMVCSDMNVTFASECEYHRQKCLCHRHEEGCPNADFAHMQLDYYGPCKDIPTCSKYEMKEFPFRMREWLFYVMEELATREELPSSATELVKEASKTLELDDVESETRKWMIPVVWKFCDIDESHDSMLNKQEMHPMVAPVKPMEPCLMPFLDHCDKDNSGNISLQEWTECLNLNPDEVEMHCSAFRD